MAQLRRPEPSPSTGLNSFFRRVCFWTIGQLSAALGIAYGLSKVSWIRDYTKTWIGVGCAGWCVSMAIAHIICPAREYSRKEKVLTKATRNSRWRLFFYLFGTICEGIAIAPILKFYPDLAPTALLFAFLNGSTGLMSYCTTEEACLDYETTFSSCLLGVVEFSMLAVVTGAFWGSNPLTQILDTPAVVLRYSLLLVFILFNSYSIKRAYEQDDADHLSCSIDYLMLPWSIFITIMRWWYRPRSNPKESKQAQLGGPQPTAIHAPRAIAPQRPN